VVFTTKEWKIVKKHMFGSGFYNDFAIIWDWPAFGRVEGIKERI